MTARPHPLVRIIGVGSPFGADRAGWDAVEGLCRSGFGNRFSGVELECADRPGVRLIERLAGTDLVVIVDALLGGTPGRIRELGPSDLLQAADGSSSHGYGVAEALGLAEAVGQSPRRLGLFGVEIGEARRRVEVDLQGLTRGLESFMSRYGFATPKTGETV